MDNVILVNEKMLERAVLFLVFFFMLPICIGADNYLVSTADEIQNLSSSLLPGDTVIMKSGEWNDEKIELNANGSEGKYIVLKAESKNSVTLSGTSVLRIAGSYIEVNGLNFINGYSSGGAVVEFRKSSSEVATYCRLTNCVIKDYNPSDKDEDYKWVSVYGQYNRVDHCEFSGKSHSGTTLVVWLSDQPNYTQIDHNYFGSRPDLGYNGGETIRIGTSTNSMKESRAIVEYNVFEECDGEIEIISNKSCFNTYRYNTFNNCDGCLTLRHGNDCTVHSNFFFGENKSSGGVRIIGERHQVYNNYFEGLKGDDYRAAICMMNGIPDSPLNRYFQVKDAKVMFNTIVDCKMPLIIGAGKDDEKTLAPVDCVFSNNVIDKTTGSKNIVIEDTPENMVWQNNVVNSNEGDEDVSTGFVFSDPSLVQEQGMWRPSSNSVLIDAAQGEFTQVINDIDGESRDNQKDIGCDEFGFTNVDNKPLEKDDVGPYTEDSEIDSSIGKGNKVVNNMVEVEVVEGKVRFCVENHSYLPIDYMLFDLSGKVLKNGKINEFSHEVNFSKGNQMVICVFNSGKDYVQSNKIFVKQI